MLVYQSFLPFCCLSVCMLQTALLLSMCYYTARTAESQDFLVFFILGLKVCWNLDNSAELVKQCKDISAFCSTQTLQVIASCLSFGSHQCISLMRVIIQIYLRISQQWQCDFQILLKQKSSSSHLCILHQANYATNWLLFLKRSIGNHQCVGILTSFAKPLLCPSLWSDSCIILRILPKVCRLDSHLDLIC